MALKNESPRSEAVQYATGEEQRTTTNSPRKNEEWSQRDNNAHLWM